MLDEHKIVPGAEHPTLKCPTCQAPAILLPASSIYSQARFTVKGMFWACKNYPSCDCYVGCHSGSDVALGTMADKRTRDKRKQAHSLFDKLWYKKQVKEKITKTEARRAGYLWLAQQLGIPTSECHIGRFTAEQCERVIELCMPYLNKDYRVNKNTQGSLEV